MLQNLWFPRGVADERRRMALEFMVNQKAKPDIPVVGGHAHSCECGEKIRHGTLADAYARSLTLPPIPNRSRDKMQFYLCRWCWYWHIGHEGKRRGKAFCFYTLAQIEAAGIENIPDPALTEAVLVKRKNIASEKIISQNPTTCSII